MKNRPTKGPFANLNQWLVVADKQDIAERWIRANFETTRDWGRSGVYWPIFDPTDPVSLIVTTGDYMSIDSDYDGYIDLRSEISRRQDLVKEIPFTAMLAARMRRHPNPYPHPEPEERDRDNPYLCRRWVSPDPYDRPGEYDHLGLPDEPEWLASALRLRRRRGSSLWDGRCAAVGAVRPGSLGDALAVGGLQRSAKGRPEVPRLFPEPGDRADRPGVPPRVGPAQRAKPPPDGPKRHHRGGPRPVHTGGLPDWMDPKRP